MYFLSSQIKDSHGLVSCLQLWRVAHTQEKKIKKNHSLPVEALTYEVFVPWLVLSHLERICNIAELLGRMAWLAP